MLIRRLGGRDFRFGDTAVGAVVVGAVVLASSSRIGILPPRNHAAELRRLPISPKNVLFPVSDSTGGGESSKLSYGSRISPLLFFLPFCRAISISSAVGILIGGAFGSRTLSPGARAIQLSLRWCTL